MSKSFEANTVSVQMTASPAAVVLDPESYDRGYEDGKQAGGGGVSDEQIQDAVNEYMQQHPVHVEETDPTVPDWAKHSDKPKYTADEVGAYDKNYVNAQLDKLDSLVHNHYSITQALETTIEGLQTQLLEESHFRGYLSTDAKIQSLEATPNDFAYSAESGTKWVYDAENGWVNTNTKVPDQLTPASDHTPLMNGIAYPGKEDTYARGDHVHPSDTSKVDKTEFNELKSDINSVLNELHNYAQALIGGAS